MLQILKELNSNVYIGYVGMYVGTYVRTYTYIYMHIYEIKKSKWLRCFSF